MKNIKTINQFDKIMKSGIRLGRCPQCGAEGGNVVIGLPWYGITGARVECSFCTYTTGIYDASLCMLDEVGRIGTPVTEQSLLLGITNAVKEWNETKEHLGVTRVHELKILPKYFSEVLCRVKNFEVMKNDRGFRVGDILLLREWDGSGYTGWRIYRRIGYILSDPEYVKEGYAVLGFAGTEVHAAKRKEDEGKLNIQCIRAISQE